MRDAGDERLVHRYHRSKACRDLDRAVEEFLPLARRIARRYARDGAGLEDLEQVACLGLVKAIKRFDPDRGFAFGAYAVPTIAGELKRHCRATRWAVHVPRGVQERVFAVRADAQRFLRDTGRQPTTAELAERLRLDFEAVAEALSAAHALGSISLDEPTGVEDGRPVSRLDRLGDEDPAYEHVECMVAIEQGMERLTGTEIEVLRLRFAEELTQVQIARRLGLPPSRVPTVLRGALAEIRALAHAGASA